VPPMRTNAFTPSFAHRSWRLLPARSRRYGLAAATSLVAPRPDRQPSPVRHGLAVVGGLDQPTGLGEGARLMLRGLRCLGVTSWPLDLTAPLGDLPPAGAPLVVHMNAPSLPGALLHLPRALLRDRRIVGYWSWELPRMPPEWRLGLRFVHEIWVPSQFTATAVATIAPGRVRVVPPPLGALSIAQAALDRSAFSLPDTAVIVLVSFNLASSLERKNPLAAIAAFRAAFGDRKDRMLLLKVGNPDHFPRDFAVIAAAAAAVPNIRIETRVLPAEDNAALLNSCDIVLSLHRAEGLGLVPAEAMLCGKPVIATGWSGNMQFMDRESAALVGYRLVPARDARHVYDLPGAVWAEPDLSEAVAQLRRLADDAAQRAALGARGRSAVIARLGVGQLAGAVRGIGLSVGLARAA
jgi:glycosyltransferase involved in cell wall biosynthesis